MSERWNSRRGRTSSWIRRRTRERIYRRDAFTCVYCGDLEGPLTLDHIVPRVLGGTNHRTNLVTACRTCNSARQHRTLSGVLLRLARVAARRKLPI